MTNPRKGRPPVKPQTAFAAVMERHRRTTGLYIREWCEYLGDGGIDVATYRRWLKGDSTPRFTTALIAQAQELAERYDKRK